MGSLLLSAIFTGTDLWASAATGTPEMEEDAICGVWFTKNNSSKVEIFKKNGLYFGKIIWLKSTDKGDFTNKMVISDMTYNQSLRVWERGKLYYPVKDEQYQGIIQLSGKDTLSIRAFLGKPFFGKTLTWVRAK